MDLIFNYERNARAFLCFGVLLAVFTPSLGWLAMVGAITCFVYAIMSHSSHVSQQLAKESLEIRKRLKVLEDQATAKQP